MGFSNDIRRKTDAMHQKIFQHPFVRGIGDGSLDVERFKFYIRQDYAYLIQYARVLALGVVKAPTLADMSKFAEIVHLILNTEMALHRSYCTEFGISEAELEATEPAPTTTAYTNFLLDTASRGTFGELVAALLPCQWGYCEIGERLAAQGEPKHTPLYCQWIRVYSDPEFVALAQWTRALADRLAHEGGAYLLHRMEEAYITSTRYEYLFWEMSYNMEGWPI